MNLSTSYTPTGQELTIFVKGVFDFRKVEAFREAYMGLNQELKRIVVDFQETENIDSSGLGMLLNLRKSFGRGQKEIQLVHCNSKVLQALQAAQFDKIFHIV